MRKTLGFGIFFALLSAVACTQDYQSRVQIVDSPNENWVNRKSQFNSTIEVVRILDSALNQCPLCGLDVEYGLSQGYVIILEHSRGISVGFSRTIPVMEHKNATAKYGKDVLATWHYTTVAWPDDSYVLDIGSNGSIVNISGRQESNPGYFQQYHELKSLKSAKTEEFLNNNSIKQG